MSSWEDFVIENSTNNQIKAFNSTTFVLLQFDELVESINVSFMKVIFSFVHDTIYLSISLSTNKFRISDLEGLFTRLLHAAVRFGKPLIICWIFLVFFWRLFLCAIGSFPCHRKPFFLWILLLVRCMFFLVTSYDPYNSKN